MLAQVEIVDKVSGKKIYVSPLLKSDEKVESDFLSDKTLGKGEHEAIATFNFYHEDNTFYYSSSCKIIVRILN